MYLIVNLILNINIKVNKLNDEQLTRAIDRINFPEYCDIKEQNKSNIPLFFKEKLFLLSLSSDENVSL